MFNKNNLVINLKYVDYHSKFWVQWDFNFFEISISFILQGPIKLKIKNNETFIMLQKNKKNAVLSWKNPE